MTETDDHTLVQAVRGGSSDAVGELFRRHWTGVWRAAFAVGGRRELADDMAQDAFERAVRDIATLNGRSSFGPWVKRIAVNRTIDYLRRERRLGELPDTLVDPAQWEGELAGDPRIARVVAALPPDQRVPVVLRYWLDFTPGEIAAALDIPIGTVASRLSRALTTLRDALGGER